MVWAMLVVVDESVRSGCDLMATIRVEPAAAGAVRRAMTGLVLPGQRRLHFKAESDRRRRHTLTVIVDLPVTADVYIVRGAAQLDARHHCLTRIITDTQAASTDSTLTSRAATDSSNATTTPSALPAPARLA